MKVKAILHGGPFAGRELQVEEDLLELRLDEETSGRIVAHRYVLQHVKAGVSHYYVPNVYETPPRKPPK